MFKQLFATMHEELDKIAHAYRTAPGDKKALDERTQVLKTMSDSFVEEWLRFEEKLTRVQEEWCAYSSEPVQKPIKAGSDKAPDSEIFQRGQGYFKLLMYDRAIQEFQQVVKIQPDFLWARVYLALGYLLVGEIAEAYRHFQFIIPLTGNAKMLAISYNGLGCIQAKNRNLEKACEFFEMAYTLDPTFIEPLNNLGVCTTQEGSLQYGSEMIHSCAV